MIAELPSRPGAYRWYYADFTAGDVTAVAIFLVGSAFSPRYSVAWRGGARPVEHCAVNFALYRGGRRRRWVFTEYPGATLRPGELSIGHSRLAHGASGAVEVEVHDRTVPWGRRVSARLHLTPEVASLPQQQLVEGAPHFWQPLAARAQGRLELVEEGLDLEGRGYFDTNHGDEPLGTSVPGWTWLRLHTSTSSRIAYWPRSAGGHLERPLWLEAGAAGVSLGREAGAAPPRSAPTGWRLSVPTTLEHGGTRFLAKPQLLESSPFYARLESQGEGAHAMAEVADFARFHRPDARWMAGFRLRLGRTA